MRSLAPRFAVFAILMALAVDVRAQSLGSAESSEHLIKAGYVYNFAWQADYASHTWRMFNYGAAAWDSANISFQNFAPGSWHHVVAEYHNDISTHSVYHDALTIDGTRYAVNARHAAFSAPGFTDKFTNAFQLDSNGTPASYSVYVDAMKVSYR